MMNQPYEPQATGKPGFSSQDIAQAHADDRGVVLIYGVNIFNDRIYSYVETTVDRLKAIKGMIDQGKDFKPSDIGNVLAAGRGEPAEDLRQEMYEKYQIAHVPPPWLAPQDTAKPVFAPPQKYQFDDEEDEA